MNDKSKHEKIITFEPKICESVKKEKKKKRNNIDSSRELYVRPKTTIIMINVVSIESKRHLSI